MFRSGFFWRLYATYILVVLGTAAVVWLLLHGQTRASVYANLEASLRQKAALLEPWAIEGLRLTDDGLQEHVSQLGRRAATRITLVDASGQVIADSDEDPGAMESHRTRPEVQDAWSTGFGVSRRFSATLGVRMLYVALRVPESGEPLGVIRTAFPVSNATAQLEQLRSRIGLGVVIGAALTLALGFYFAQRLTAPVRVMTRAAASLKEGALDTRVSITTGDEFESLGDALNQLGAELSRKLHDITRDEARLRAILAGMVESVVAVDATDRVVFSNSAARKLFNIGRTQHNSARVYGLIRIVELEGLIEEARAQEGAAARELVLGHEGGESVLQAKAHRFQDTEEAGGVIIVFHDITELRKLERVRRDFVANVSHELKTPLTSIRGYVETLLDGALHDEENNERFLRRIDDNVKRLNHLVSDLLSLARIESQQGRIQIKRINWRPIVEQALSRQSKEAENKGIACTFKPNGADTFVMGDAEALTEVADNLLSNAIKYSPNNSAVTLDVHREGDFSILEVKDTGYGIPPEDLERVFERFYCVDKARTRSQGGTGLGLSIVKHLVQSMSGEVTVESTLGEGTRFRVKLPAVEA